MINETIEKQSDADESTKIGAKAKHSEIPTERGEHLPIEFNITESHDLAH